MNPQQPFDPNQPYGGPQTQGQTQVPVRQGEVYNSPTLANVPYGSQPAPVPQTGIQSNNPVSANTKAAQKGPKIAIVVGVVVAVILIVVAVVASMSGSKKPVQKNEKTQQSSASQSFQPAQAIEVEETSNALSQDLSGVDDEKDFPAGQLDDKSIGL